MTMEKNKTTHTAETGERRAIIVRSTMRDKWYALTRWREEPAADGVGNIIEVVRPDQSRFDCTASARKIERAGISGTLQALMRAAREEGNDAAVDFLTGRTVGPEEISWLTPNVTLESDEPLPIFEERVRTGLEPNVDGQWGTMDQRVSGKIPKPIVKAGP